MMAIDKSSYVLFWFLIFGSTSLSGCISPDLGPFEDYQNELLGGPDHLVRLATYYNPEFTGPEDRQSAESYGLHEGTPANVGRWAGARVGVHEIVSRDPGGEDESRSNSCESVSPGSTLEPLSPDGPQEYCVTFDEDDRGRTYFFLPGDDSYELSLGVDGLADNGVPDDDCISPYYRTGGGVLIPGGTVTPAESNRVDLLIESDQDILLHFGIYCGGYSSKSGN